MKSRSCSSKHISYKRLVEATDSFTTLALYKYIYLLTYLHNRIWQYIQSVYLNIVNTAMSPIVWIIKRIQQTLELAAIIMSEAGVETLYHNGDYYYITLLLHDLVD